MSQPTPYTPAYDFTDFQSENPSIPLPADKIDAELASVEISVGQVCVNMALLQADDGTLRVNVVTPQTLNSATLALMASTGNVRGMWATNTSYAGKDVVNEGSGTYICAVPHTSGTFATDLAAVEWILLAGSTGSVSFASLSDVTFTTLVNHNIATYNGFKWVNGLLVDASITPGTISFASLAAATTISSATMSGASNSNVPTSSAIKSYVDTSVSRGTGAPVASATTTSLTGNTFDWLHVTGTTTITALTLATDEEKWVIFDGALTLTYNSTSLILPSKANITTAAGDRALFRGIDGTNVECLTYVPASGKALVAASAGVVTIQTQAFISSGTYTPSAGMLYCIVEMVGGGSTGGNGSSNAGGGGGGAGAYTRSRLTAAQVGSSQTVTCGAATATTSLGSLVTAPGGSAGNSASGNVAGVGGTGGSTGTGDIAVAGQYGANGGSAATAIGVGGGGGNTLFGSGGRGASGSGAGGNPALGYGSGGGGGGFGSGSGGNATTGAVYITEYCSQ